MLSSKELDLQSDLAIDKWVDVDSEEWHLLNDDPTLTKKIIRLGFQAPAFLITDEKGRIWGRGPNSPKYFPLHFEYGSQLIGVRIAAKAAN